MFISLLKCLRYSQSTGHIPQVRSTCHCSKDELPNHTDSPLSNRALFVKSLVLANTINAIHLSVSW